MATDNKAAILRAASPKLPAPRKPVPAPAAKPAPVVAAPATPAPVAAPESALDAADQQLVDNMVSQQFSHIKENIRRANLQKVAQAAVEAQLKAEGISLDNINADHLAQQHLADLETQTAEKAAREKAKELFKAKYGKEFVS